MFFLRRAGDKFYPRGDVVDNDFVAGDLTKDDAWHDLDLSAIIGVGKSLVFIRAFLDENTGGKFIKLRTKGHTNNTNISACYTQVANKICDHTLSIYTDSNGIIEYLISTATWTTLTLAVRGWFK